MQVKDRTSVLTRQPLNHFETPHGSVSSANMLLILMNWEISLVHTLFLKRQAVLPKELLEERERTPWIPLQVEAEEEVAVLLCLTRTAKRSGSIRTVSVGRVEFILLERTLETWMKLSESQVPVSVLLVESQEQTLDVFSLDAS